MSASFEKYQKRRLRSSYLSVIVSIALVLFLVGLFGLLLIGTNSVSKHLKEQVAIGVYFKENVKETDIKTFQKKLEKKEFTKKVSYTSKEAAAKQYIAETGEDFMEFLGDNPLQASLDVYVKSAFVSEEKIKNIEKEIIKSTLVSDISYDKPLVELLVKNINKLSFWMLLFSGVFTLIAIALINSSIRLSVYSKRFTIKTMQMVGATKSFIRKPFVWKSIRLGVLGALLAIACLAGMLFYVHTYIQKIDLLVEGTYIGFLFAGILILGIIISWLSTYFATQRFLNLRTEELYY